MILTGFDEDHGTAFATRRIRRYTLVEALIALADLVKLDDLARVIFCCNYRSFCR